MRQAMRKDAVIDVSLQSLPRPGGVPARTRPDDACGLCLSQSVQTQANASFRVAVKLACRSERQALTERGSMMKPAAGNRANKQKVNLAELLAKAILSTRSAAIVATDRDGIIRVWNPGAERVFGHSREEAVGRSRGRAAMARVTCSRFRHCATMARRSRCSSRSPHCGKRGRWSAWPRSSAT